MAHLTVHACAGKKSPCCRDSVPNRCTLVRAGEGKHTPTPLQNLPAPADNRTRTELPGVRRDVPGIDGELPSVRGDVPGIDGELPSVRGDVPGVDGKLPSVRGDVRSVSGERIRWRGRLG